MKPALYLTCLLLAALLLLPHRALAEPASTILCFYQFKEADPNGYSRRREKCAYLRGDQVVVSSAALSRMDFSKQGLAAIWAEDHEWFYVRRDGSTIPTLRFEAGPAPFVDGLARYTDHDKVGFINESGDIVIPARYAFTDVFNYGYAMVNNGGHVVEAGDEEMVTEAKGGHWGCIDTKGKVVIPVKYSYGEASRKLKALGSRAVLEDELTDNARQAFQRSKH